ncbi:MAG TPA: Type 1 glutamine amidotransferase-like domain-containing protein [Gaiellaceae bacterium]|nr:Type 1 glutamine amidotransferase-like domain-containing protein [Gaiellaceae bacterium]
MKLLLTSAGIRNTSIREALVELLGKRIEEATAYFVPTGIYPFPGGPGMAWNAISGNSKNPLCDLGWKSLGVLELTALTTIQRESWVPALRETDALLVWGGDVLYLRHWMQASGLADLLPSLTETVYVGVSAGSIVLTPYNCDAEFDLQFVPEGSDMGEDAGAGLGLVDFALRVHLDAEGFDDSTMAEVLKWAAGIPAPTYAIDDETAIKITDDTIEVVSEGTWKLLTP